MSPYWVIAIVILALYIGHRLALARYQKRRNEQWLMVAMLAMVLEVEARKARDRRKALDKDGDS